MKQHHRSHLISTYTTALQHLDEIRQAAVAGKSPGGGLLTPLPEPLRDRLVAGLDAIAAGLEEVVRAFVPDGQRAAAEPAGPAATRMWISILLRTVEELVHDLLPARMSRKYGALEAAEAAQLEARVESVLASVRAAMQELEREGGPRRRG